MAVHLSAEDPCCAAKPERFISASPAAAQPGPPFVRTVALITRDDTAKINRMLHTIGRWRRIFRVKGGRSGPRTPLGVAVGGLPAARWVDARGQH